MADAHFIRLDARSTLHEGIETIVIPIIDGHDLNSLALQTQRGTYAVVEWLLSQLSRSREIDRVCGLSIGLSGPHVVANLELRQPGKQFEEWMRGAEPLSWEGLGIILSKRACESGQKFSDLHKPWWTKQQEAPNE